MPGTRPGMTSQWKRRAVQNRPNGPDHQPYAIAVITIDVSRRLCLIAEYVPIMRVARSVTHRRTDETVGSAGVVGSSSRCADFAARFGMTVSRA
jgi:hypothetical protein